MLKYLLTAFDGDENSDSAIAHELIGRGIAALHELNFLALDALVATDVRLALENNPEPLKLTFDETTADLLSKIMQGTDERYRLSIAFQMRPVMIVPAPSRTTRCSSASTTRRRPRRSSASAVSISTSSRRSGRLSIASSRPGFRPAPRFRSSATI